jgi:anion-transporting  ArsA/GET3 family ATPase
MTAGLSVVTNALTKVLGAQVLRDMQTFVAALETMFGGFRERAQATYDLLKAPGTSFVVVAAPERDALREASYFVERLRKEEMPLAGLVLNRVHGVVETGLTSGRALSVADGLDPASLTAGVLRLHAERVALVRREERLTGRFTSAHPGVPVAEVAAQPGDVHDLEGLRRVGADLSAGGR